MQGLKLKAGALQVTLFIGVVIALLLTSFILLVHTKERFNVQNQLVIETAKNTNRAIAYALNNPVPLGDSTTVVAMGEGYKSLTLDRQFWGVFEKITAVSKIKNYRIEKAALIGGLSNYNQRPALYIQDNNNPLVVVGETRIEGLSYVPERGVKSGTISGVSYYGTQLMYGKTRRSDVLPTIATETSTHIDGIERLLSGVNQDQFLNIETLKNHKNSFLAPTQIIFSNAQIDLRELHLTGNIIVQSKRKIVVHRDVGLQDVILIAPDIEIRNNVVGCFQAIASKTIEVGEGVQLRYPSALVLNDNTQDKSTVVRDTVAARKITIRSNSKIKGVVMYLGSKKRSNYDAQLAIANNTTVIGEVYCSQNLELKGTVLGSVFTNNCIVRASGSVYLNHIYDGKIISDDLPDQYVGLSFDKSKKGVVKWLY